MERALSPEEHLNIGTLRARIQQVENELKVAANTPGGSETMKVLRRKMERIEKDLIAAEESTKEHFALEHLRARMEKVERLLSEGERAAKDWEALEDLRNKIGNVDSDLRAVEEAKREFEALEALRSKMEEVESELHAAELLASDRENVEKLRTRLGQVERELGVADRTPDDPTSVERLLSRLAQAERSLEDARESTKFSERQYNAVPLSDERGTTKLERDEEVEKILERLALAEKKLKVAKDSAQQRNLVSQPVDQSRFAPRAPSTTPFDERQSKIRARLQEHLDENDRGRRDNEKEVTENEEVSPWRQRDDLPSAGNKESRGYRAKFEEPRSLGGLSRDRYFVQDVQLDRDLGPRPMRYQDDVPQTQPQPSRPTRYKDDVPHTQPQPSQPKRYEDDIAQAQTPGAIDRLEEKLGTDLLGAATRPLRRRWASRAPDQDIKPSKSMPHSVLGSDEDRYLADLEELRYQRALLSQKFPNRSFEDEEKKAEDKDASGPSYPSFREVIRNEEKQRLRQKMQPPREKSPPKQRVEEVKTGQDPPKAGGDPPEEAKAKDENSDPPSQAKYLQERLQSQSKTTRDPTSSQTKDRPSPDPPESAQPLAVAKPKAPAAEAPPRRPRPVVVVTQTRVQPAPDAGDDSTFSEEFPSTVLPEDVPSPPEVETPRAKIPSVVQPETLIPPQRQPREAPEEVDAEVPPPFMLPPPEMPEQPKVEKLPEPPQPPPPPPPPPQQPQQPIIHQTTVVGGRAAERERRERDQLLRWVVVVMLCVAVILAVVIVVVVVLLRDTSTDVAPTPSPFPPSQTFSPTEFGDRGNLTTSAPTTEGEGNEGPLDPTLDELDGVLDGMLGEGCPELDDPQPLSTNGVITDRSTEGALFDASNLSTCGSVQEIGNDGVWYAMIGLGETVTIHTCTIFFPSFDTQLLVYTPANLTMGCGEGSSELQCVTANDDFCGRQSSVTFYAMRDAAYFIYVNGKSTAGFTSSQSAGDFALTLYSSPEGSCTGALGPLEVTPDDSQLPVILVGTLMGGTYGIDPCNPSLATRTGELWYSINGTGTMVIASTCHAVSSFPARLAVYSGDCDDLLCVASDDEDCGLGSEISWFAEEDVEYNLLVYSPEFVSDATFGISVQAVS